MSYSKIFKSTLDLPDRATSAQSYEAEETALLQGPRRYSVGFMLFVTNVSGKLQSTTPIKERFYEIGSFSLLTVHIIYKFRLNRSFPTALLCFTFFYIVKTRYNRIFPLEIKKVQRAWIKLHAKA
jgi:hypothetical protein